MQSELQYCCEIATNRTEIPESGIYNCNPVTVAPRTPHLGPLAGPVVRVMQFSVRRTFETIAFPGFYRVEGSRG